ncbi:MAG TPA: hypothetical protein VG122_04375 [Gemmata sp.]|nr:hypothetical protein [Gemmata sp.]
MRPILMTMCMSGTGRVRKWRLILARANLPHSGYLIQGQCVVRSSAESRESHLAEVPPKFHRGLSPVLLCFIPQQLAVQGRASGRASIHHPTPGKGYNHEKECEPLLAVW